MGCNESSEQAPLFTKARTVDIKSLTKNSREVGRSPVYQQSDFRIKVIDIRDEAEGQEDQDSQTNEKREEQEYDFESPMRSKQKSLVAKSIDSSKIEKSHAANESKIHEKTSDELNVSQKVDSEQLRSSQYQSSTNTPALPSNYVHPDFETDKSDNGNLHSKQQSEAEIFQNSSMLIIHNREESEISRDLFRADMILTEGDQGEAETPDCRSLYSRKNKDAPQLNTIAETEESQNDFLTPVISGQVPNSTLSQNKEVSHEELESQIPNELHYQMLLLRQAHTPQHHQEILQEPSVMKPYMMRKGVDAEESTQQEEAKDYDSADEEVPDECEDSVNDGFTESFQQSFVSGANSSVRKSLTVREQRPSFYSVSVYVDKKFEFSMGRNTKNIESDGIGLAKQLKRVKSSLLGHG